MSLFSGQETRRQRQKAHAQTIWEEDPGEDYLANNILALRLGHSPGPLSILIRKWLKMGCKIRMSRDPLNTSRKTYCLSDVKRLYALRPDSKGGKKGYIRK